MAILKQFCCGCSLQMGTIIIGVIYMIWSLEPIATLVPRLYSERYIYDDKDQTWRVWDNKLELEVAFGSGFIQAICGIFLLFGASLENAGMLLPWIIVETMDLIVRTAVDLLSCLALIVVTAMYTVGFIAVVSVVISSLVSVYCLLIVFSYYQTLPKDAKATTDRETVQV